MPNKIRKAKKQSSFSSKLGITDWLIIAVLAVLIVTPDPLDLATAGLPLLEGLFALIYLVVRFRNAVRTKT